MADLFTHLESALDDRYHLERELGRGGMATVYLAQDRKHHRRVALKVLHPELAYALGGDRFLREIEVAAKLTHPHILPLHDSGEVEGLLYYVMPYIEGESLRDRLRRETHLSLEDALQIAREVADALGYAHGQGVIHRDIKPENILLYGGHALVVDFGIARALWQADEGRLTETGLAVGTAAYMSPEQASGGQVDGRSDVYSLGCVVYEMLVGEPPYTGPNAQAIIAKRFSDPVPSARRLRTAIPPALDQAVTRSLATVPADRFATAAEFAEALCRPSVEVRAPGPAPKRRQALLAIAAVFVLALVSVWFQQWRWNSDAGGTASALTAARHPLVAVLPFQTIGSDTAQHYFTAGMTEEVASQLAGVAALRVVSSAVTRRYEGAADRTPRMHRELGVGSVVTGSVRLAGQQVRIAVQLADARTGQALWSEQYDRKLSDVFEVQGDVARRVAGALRATLTSAELRRLELPVTVNPEAYDLYLRAMDMSQTSAGEMEAGVVLLQRALGIDSSYVDARAALARRYLFLSMYGNPAYADSALSTVRMALAAQPDHASALATLADLQFFGGRLTEGRRSYAKALALNPSNVVALHDLSMAETSRGRPDEGLKWSLRAGPLSGHDPLFYFHVALALIRLERDELTEAWLEAGKKRPPENFSRLENVRVVLDWLRGDGPGALARVRALVARRPENEEAQANLADLATLLAEPDAERLLMPFVKANPHTRPGWISPESFGALHGLLLHRRGERTRADSLWNEALAADRREIAEGNEGPERWVQTAAIHAIRGNEPAALTWLERAYQMGWNDARALQRDPFFERLRQVPRFRDLLGRMTADIAKMREGVRAITDSLRGQLGG